MYFYVIKITKDRLELIIIPKDKISTLQKAHTLGGLSPGDSVDAVI